MLGRLPFRARIALLSAGISGFWLALFAAGCWGMVHATDLASVDRNLMGIGQPQVGREEDAQLWGRLEGAIALLAGAHRGLEMMAIDRSGKVLHQSPGWPTEFAADRFPRPIDDLGPPPDMLGMPPPDGPPPRRRGMGPPPGGPPLPTREPRFRTMPAAGGAYRVAVMGNQNVTLVLALRLDAFHHAQRILALRLFAAWLAALAGIGLGGWLVASQAMRPVAQLSAAAARITASRLDDRIPTTGMGAEFETLTRLLNQMLERLQRSFEQANRFSADAAHELRTPLTILQGELEAAIQTAPDGSTLQGHLADMLDEVHRLTGLVRKLLLLAEADAGQMQLDRRDLDLAALVRDAADDATALGPELTIAVRVPDSLMVDGDHDLLGMAVSNLVHNAVRYNRPDGRVGITLGSDGGEARLTVRNTGPGIPAEKQARIFERFFRADLARSRAAGGVGLGMSLAREIARAHGGDLALTDGRPEQTTFVLSLPLSRTA